MTIPKDVRRINGIKIGDAVLFHGLPQALPYLNEHADAIIAASALVTNSSLVTRNTKDFEKIRNLKIEKPY